jgi:SagB-type dehydrogenase family enzyme
VFVRNPNLLVCWKGERLSVRNLENGKAVLGTPELVEVLDRFGRPSGTRQAVSRLKGYDRRSVLAAIRRLRGLDFLLTPKEAEGRGLRLVAWKQNLASVLYHVASRNARYLKTPAAAESFFRKRLDAERQPPRFKSYPRAVNRNLSRAKPGEDAAVLSRILENRRTVREFSRSPVSFEAFSALIRGTWGMTGQLDAGVLGKLLTKTSPSAGARHPIECYVIAWNVRSLRPGLYHYDVRSDELRRLKSGDLSREAVEAASGQRYVARAAFLCVMTACFDRTLWKYPTESAYRVVWLDAGHLAQTFCLLATSLGLGPFQTAAIQDSYIEKLIGLDGIKEFPVYLCGAGVPAKRLR